MFFYFLLIYILSGIFWYFILFVFMRTQPSSAKSIFLVLLITLFTICGFYFYFDVTMLIFHLSNILIIIKNIRIILTFYRPHFKIFVYIFFYGILGIILFIYLFIYFQHGTMLIFYCDLLSSIINYYT